MLNCKWVYTPFRMTRYDWRVVCVCIHHDIADIFLVNKEGAGRHIPMDNPEAHERLGARTEFETLPALARAWVRLASTQLCERRYMQFRADDIERDAQRISARDNVDAR